MKPIKTIDLFAGCGGLTEGFAQTGLYKTSACVEWEEAPCLTLRKRLKEKWGVKNADEVVIRFDMQRTKELLEGFSDEEYGCSNGLIDLVGSDLDLVIGGPPCQAYSVAGRIRDEHGMKNDYRNYLFESYLSVVSKLKPKAFVFENVPGILSAKPGERMIKDIIYEEFSAAGYTVLSDLKKALIDVSGYGVPQFRKRVIILGVRNDIFGTDTETVVKSFYDTVLPSFKCERLLTLADAIADLPPLYPSNSVTTIGGIKTAHTVPNNIISNHIARYHNERDMKIFEMLSEDIENGKNEYSSIEARKKLYTEYTGKQSSIHKYHVLKWNEPSTTIPAHLCKDGLRHIHPDSKQARSITVREAARIQTFPDDFEFISAMTANYKMIGNAVPPEFGRRLALAVYKLLFSEE